MKLGNKEMFIGLSMLTLLYLLVLFGMQGIIFFLAIGIIFMTPLCLIIHKIGVSMEETLMFSLFLGLGILPSMIYYLALVIGSITMAGVMVWTALMAVGWIVYKKTPTLSA